MNLGCWIRKDKDEQLWYIYNQVAFFDPDVLAFFAATGITKLRQKQAINYLVLSLKSAGIWNKFFALYPFVGGTATAHSYNLRNTAQFQITWSGNVVHNSLGISLGDTTGYGNTGFNPVAQSVSNTDFSLSVYKRAMPSGSGSFCYLGAETTAGTDYAMLAWYLSGSRETVGLAGASAAQYSPAGTVAYFPGLLSGIVNGSRVQNAYRNGVILTNPTTASGTYPNLDLYLLASNIGGNPSNRRANFALSFAAIGLGRTASEELLFYGIVQNYQTILGRAV